MVKAKNIHVRCFFHFLVRTPTSKVTTQRAFLSRHPLPSSSPPFMLFVHCHNCRHSLSFFCTLILSLLLFLPIRHTVCRRYIFWTAFLLSRLLLIQSAVQLSTLAAGASKCCSPPATPCAPSAAVVSIGEATAAAIRHPAAAAATADGRSDLLGGDDQRWPAATARPHRTRSGLRQRREGQVRPPQLNIPGGGGVAAAPTPPPQLPPLSALAWPAPPPPPAAVSAAAVIPPMAKGAATPTWTVGSGGSGCTNDEGACAAAAGE